MFKLGTTLMLVPSTAEMGVRSARSWFPGLKICCGRGAIYIEIKVLKEYRLENCTRTGLSVKLVPMA